jgi:hypothetical protein
METVTVTVRPVAVSVIRHDPVANPPAGPLPVTLEHSKVVVALDGLLGAQDIPVTDGTDHENVYDPLPPDTMLAVVEFVVIVVNILLDALTDVGDV